MSWPERFWRHVPVPVGDECMEWTGGTQVGGYGQTRPPWSKHPTVANRAMWSLMHGPIPKGMVVRHACDNPPCVRPDHLVLGTMKENVRDCIERGRFKIGGTRHYTKPRKTTAEDRQKIRDARAAGAKTRHLAEQYGVSTTTVQSIYKEN